MKSRKKRHIKKRETFKKINENNNLYVLEKNVCKNTDEISCDEKIKKLKNEFRKIVASLDNDLKKKDIILQDEKKFALQDFFESFLSEYLVFLEIINNGKASENNEIKLWAQTFGFAMDNVEKLLNSFGVYEIPAKIGDSFDPENHELVEGTADIGAVIVEIVTPGYKLHNRTLKYVNVSTDVEKR